MIIVNQDRKNRWEETLKNPPRELKIRKKSKDGEIVRYPSNAIANAEFIIMFDDELKDAFTFEEMSHRYMVKEGALPWDNNASHNITNHSVLSGPSFDGWRIYCDSDLSQLRVYLSANYDYEIGSDSLDGVVKAIAKNNRWNFFVEYLETLPPWDGIERISTLFHDYLGAEATALNGEIAKKILVAAIARSFSDKPVKFDNMAILTGKQGIGKSLLLARLGGEGFIDSINSFENRIAEEQIQGMILAEIPEMEAFSKSTVNRVKQFLSKNTDIYREPYSRTASEHIRRTVFVGTTNNESFLRDETGGRRFLPVRCSVTPILKNVYTDLTKDEVDLIWSEAYLYYKQGEPLVFDKAMLHELEILQEEHREKNPWEEMIINYLDIEIPSDWYSRTLPQMMSWMESERHTNALCQNPIPTVKRDKIALYEIWTVCLQQPEGSFGKDISHSRKINAIIDALPDWKRQKVRYGSRTCSGARKINGANTVSNC